METIHIVAAISIDPTFLGIISNSFSSLFSVNSSLSPYDRAAPNPVAIIAATEVPIDL